MLENKSAEVAHHHKPSQAKPSQAKPSQAKRSQAKRSEARPGQAARPGQVKPSQARSKRSQANPSQHTALLLGGVRYYCAARYLPKSKAEGKGRLAVEAKERKTFERGTLKRLFGFWFLLFWFFMLSCYELSLGSTVGTNA